VARLNALPRGELSAEAKLFDGDTIAMGDDGTVEDLLAILADEALPFIRPVDCILLVAAMARVAVGGTFVVG
jgi:hypothetical protein